MTFAVNIAQGGSNNVTMRNRIINGNMLISQRYGTSSVTPGSGTYPIDRFQNTQSTASSFSYQQVAPPTALAGFVYCQKATVLAARTPAAGDRYDYLQAVEGLNITDLAWGTSSAKAVTASFWVYSSVTGTFAVSISNGGINRSYVNTYTISSANTWTQVTVTFPGCPDGTWSTDNGTGLILFFDLGCGSNSETTAGAWQSGFYERTSACVKLVNTVSATFYITGVQLEAGTTASPFEYRQYGTELSLCYRYYYRIKPGGSGSAPFQGAGVSYTTSLVRFTVPFGVTMRAAPSALEQTGTAGDYAILQSSAWSVCTSVPSMADTSPNSVTVTFTSTGSFTAGGGAIARDQTGNAYLGWSAEL
jgi:hypothetical protein